MLLSAGRLNKWAGRVAILGLVGLEQGQQARSQKACDVGALLSLPQTYLIYTGIPVWGQEGP